MNIQISDLVDRATILKIKLENGLDVKEEYERIMYEIIDIDEEEFNDLYEINKKIWAFEAMVGNLALQSRYWNGKRSEKKNKITAKYGGFREKKKYQV